MATRAERIAMARRFRETAIASDDAGSRDHRFIAGVCDATETGMMIYDAESEMLELTEEGKGHAEEALAEDPRRYRRLFRQ